MTFQLLLIAVLLGFAVFVIRLPGLGRGRKTAILMLVSVMLAFAIRPDWSTDAAKLLGISRGVDLLFYVSHLALFLLTFMFFLKLRRVESRMSKLVRQLALEPGRAERRRQAESHSSAVGDAASGEISPTKLIKR